MEEDLNYDGEEVLLIITCKLKSQLEWKHTEKGHL